MSTVKVWQGVSVATTSRKVHTFRGGEYVAALMAELSRAGIAQRIATAREQAGLTQPELAEVMHVHYRTVQDWESPKKQATPWDRLDELAAVTGVRKEWLLHGELEEAVPDAATLHRRLSDLEGAVEQTREDVGEAIELLRQLVVERGAGQESPAAGQR
jgi:transcriptional regulator with XRE-family HTH domain